MKTSTKTLVTLVVPLLVVSAAAADSDWHLSFSETVVNVNPGDTFALDIYATLLDPTTMDVNGYGLDLSLTSSELTFIDFTDAHYWVQLGTYPKLACFAFAGFETAYDYTPFTLGTIRFQAPAAVGSYQIADTLDPMFTTMLEYPGGTPGYFSGQTPVTVNTPEPASMAILGLGGLGILVRRRRRRT